MININNCINQNVGKNYNTIQVTNNGLFIAKFSISYIYKGTFYSKSSDEFGTARTEKVKYPDAAVQCAFIVSYYYDQTHSIVLYRQNFQYAQNKCFVLKGTVANPTCEEVPCQSVTNLYPCKCYPYSNYNYYMH